MRTQTVDISKLKARISVLETKNSELKKQLLPKSDYFTVKSYLDKKPIYVPPYFLKDRVHALSESWGIPARIINKSVYYHRALIEAAFERDFGCHTN